MYSDDPLKDFAAYEEKLEKEIEDRPICCECGERILDEYAYQINGWICEACMEEHRMEIEIW